MLRVEFKVPDDVNRLSKKESSFGGLLAKLYSYIPVATIQLLSSKYKFLGKDNDHTCSVLIYISFICPAVNVVSNVTIPEIPKTGRSIPKLYDRS